VVPEVKNTPPFCDVDDTRDPIVLPLITKSLKKLSGKGAPEPPLPKNTIGDEPWPNEKSLSTM
jgi:hypothetical protein